MGWRHEIRPNYYYEFKQFKIYWAYRQAERERLANKFDQYKFETYLSDNRHSVSGARFFSTVSEGGLYRFYKKGDITIIYGMFKFGNIPHVWIPYELINITNQEPEEHIDFEDVMIKIEGRVELSLIERALYIGDIEFNYDVDQDKITVVELNKCITKFSLPPAIQFVIGARKRGIKVVA